MNFILRRISSQGVEMNFNLGKSYTVVNRFTAYEEFKTSFEQFYCKPHVADLDPKSDDETKLCYAFVGGYGGIDIYPLFNKQKAYIMTENGDTFSNLTIKE